MPELSDPARQLHQLCETMRKHKSDESATKALSAMLGVTAHSSEYYVFLGAIASRFTRLGSFISDTMHDPARETGLDALVQLQAFMKLPPQGGGKWNAVRANLFPEAAMNSLAVLSAFAADRAPISVPTPEERDEAVSKIDAAMSALEGQHDALSNALYESLAATKKMIQLFIFWGGEAINDELIRGLAIFNVAQKQAPQEARSALRMVGVAFLAVLAFNGAVDNQLTSIENNYGRGLKVLEYLKPGPLLLTDQSAHPMKTEEQAILPDRSLRQRRKRSEKK